MTYADSFRRGAARVRRTSHVSPREIAVRLIESDKTASIGKLVSIFWEEIREEPDVLRALAEAEMTNAYHDYSARTRRKPRTTPGEQREANHRVALIGQEVRRVVLLDVVFPNGKKARNCTREDGLAFGGFWTKACQKMKPGQLIGDVYTEEKIRKFWTD